MSSDPRTAILEAAGEVFARYGFKKASMEEIARRAGVGKGSIYLHFEDKEALFDACARQGMARGLSELKTTVLQAKTPAEQLHAYIRCRLEQHSRAPVGPRIELSTLFELGTQAVHLIPQMQEDETQVLTDIIESGIAQGVFSVSEPRLTARGFVEIINSLGPRLMTQEPDDRLRHALETCFAVFARGLTVPPRPTS